MARSNGLDFTLDSSRASSPDDNDNNAFTTGMSFQNALHSTPQRGPSHYDQFHGYAEPSMHDSEQDHAYSPSIEMGRGVKSGARDDFLDDHSSNFALSFGNDNSMYEVVNTPPSRPRNNLRKDASVRRATESAKANDALKRSSNNVKSRAVSDNVRYHQEPASAQHTETINGFNVRGSRFTSTRKVSTQSTAMPTRFTSQGGLEFNNQTATAISATYNTSQTNQSFMLPDLSNINELVLGVRKDGTPVAKRTSRSRFTSASYNPPTLSHIPVNGVEVPHDEKAIYASLQMLKGRLTQLEMENSEAHKRAEQYEAEVINLRSQANAPQRPDSGLGSDDDDETLGPMKSKLQASVQALQDHISRYERKVNVSEAAVSRVTKERDALITQIGQAYLKHEELVSENEAFRETQGSLLADNEDLRQEVKELREEKRDLQQQLEKMKSLQQDRDAELRRSQAKASREANRKQEGDIAGGPWNLTENRTNVDNSIRSRKREERTTIRNSQTTRRDADGVAGSSSARDMAFRIEREIQKLREEARSRDPHSNGRPSHCSGSARSRSRSQRRRSTNDTEHTVTKTSRRNFSAPIDGNDIDPTATGKDATATGKDATTTYQKHGSSRAAEQAQVERDLTLLSELNFDLAANLRKRLEEERTNRAKRVTTEEVEVEHTGRSATRQTLPRKSSMKDVTSGADEGTGRFSIRGQTIEELLKTGKTVRVQSPHSSDATFHPQQPEVTEIEDASMVSNTSRRRRRSSMEGMTSAFIIPDITIQGTEALDLGEACIKHNSAGCTACSSSGTKVDIPMPVPVTDRNLEDVTNATIRPAQPPAEALATVIKNLEDEITHLKMQKEVQNQAYNQHDPALSKHRRLAVKAELHRLMILIDKRCDQVYALYDVLEGQKKQGMNMTQEIDESIEVGRQAPAGLADEDDFSGMESDELPWEGLSESED